MKITRFEIDDFRGFPGPDPYVFDFAGKNVLIFGENGSGKTSVFHALREFFNASADPRPFHQFKHRYSPQIDGFVAATFSDGNRYQWSYGADRPIAIDVVAQTARRKGCLDYRALLQTSFLHGRKRVNIFDLVVEELWRDVLVPTGGRTVTVGYLWKRALDEFPHKIGSRGGDGLMHWRWQHATQSRMRRVRARLTEFNDAFRSQIGTLQNETNRLLGRYLGSDLNVTIDFPGVAASLDNRSPNATELWLDVQFRGTILQEHQNELNEARLTALAIALFAGGLRTGIPPDPTKPRLLVLDDVLIGLDLSNRMPLLELLKGEFADWQVVLMTHDSVWFELAKEFTEQGGDWTYLRLFDAPHPHFVSAPRLEADANDLDRARRHLTLGDLKAAAVYARSALEKRLRKVCNDKSVRVRFRANPKALSADDLWQGILARNQEDIAKGRAPFIDPGLASRIEAVRSVVLNDLSHSRCTSLTSGELIAATHAVEDLQRFSFA